MPSLTTGGTRSMGSGKHYPAWVTDKNDSMQKKVLRWSYLTMMRQRGILYRDIAEYLGVTPARVDQMITKMGEKDQMRIDEAITVITEEKHYAVGHKDEDPTCAVITIAMRDYPKSVRENRIELTKEEISGIEDFED